jgi:hypothetical protein
MSGFEQAEGSSRALQINADASGTLLEDAHMELASSHKSSSGNGYEEYGKNTVMLAPGQGWDNTSKANNLKYRCQYGYYVHDEKHNPPNMTICAGQGRSGGGFSFSPGLNPLSWGLGMFLM